MTRKKWHIDKEFLETLLRIGLPIAIQNVLASSLSLIDSLMVGSLGETALAAVGVANQWGGLLFSCYWGINCGGVLFFAQYWGAKDYDGIRRAYGITMVSMLLVSLVFFNKEFWKDEKKAAPQEMSADPEEPQEPVA